MTDNEIRETVRDMLRVWDALTAYERARALRQASEAAMEAAEKVAECERKARWQKARRIERRGHP